MIRRKREHVSDRIVGGDDWVERKDPTAIPVQHLNTPPLSLDSGKSENGSMVGAGITTFEIESDTPRNSIEGKDLDKY